MAEETPENHFLMPTERKYPYKNSDGSISCNMLRAAMSSAGRAGDRRVEEMAKQLFNDNCSAT